MGNAIVQVNRRKFEIIRKLATGGFSYVYEARDVITHQYYAIKYIACFENEQVQLVLKEIELHRRIDHPNILQLDAAEIRTAQQGVLNNASNCQNEALLVFPLYRHGTLQDYLDKYTDSKPFNQEQCLHIFLQIVRAVLAIHQCGLAHRDIKPGNILLDIEEGYLPRPIVMDLGSASTLHIDIQNRHDAISLQEHASIYSSAAYRAPELYDATNYQFVDGRTDVWSLGCLLYSMAFGPYSPFESPIEGIQTLGILNGNVHFPKDKISRFSNNFISLIQYMLNPNANLRPQLQSVEEKAKKMLRNGNDILLFSPRQQISTTTNSIDHDMEEEYGEFCCAFPRTLSRTASQLHSPELQSSATRLAVSRSHQARGRRAKSEHLEVSPNLGIFHRTSFDRQEVLSNYTQGNPKTIIQKHQGRGRQRTCSYNSFMTINGKELFTKALG